MVGKDNGMTVCLKRLIQHDMGNESCSFHSIWCMSHRLNLVVRGFERVEHIKDVLKFSDWFASRRKAVSFRRWLCGQNPNISCKKIPTPSETRWCFFSAVIDALLDQTKEIDLFLSQDEDFHSFRRSLWQPDASTGTDPTEAFLNNPFVFSHFKFAQSILEKICRVNSQLQQTYMTVPQAWWLIQKLKDSFSRDLNEISSGNYGNFTYLEGMNDCQKTTFKTILTSLLLNMDIRFACPSLSIDTRVAHRNVDPITQRLNKQFLQNVQRQCVLFEIVGLFLFPDDLIKKREINPLFISGKYPEVPLMARDILVKEDIIKCKTRHSTQRTNGEPETYIITLSDVFKIIEKGNYPQLWNLTKRVMSVTPTSASCEQSFSCLKRRLHENMKKKTAFNFLLTSQNNSVFNL